MRLSITRGLPLLHRRMWKIGEANSTTLETAETEPDMFTEDGSSSDDDFNPAGSESPVDQQQLASLIQEAEETIYPSAAAGPIHRLLQFVRNKCFPARSRRTPPPAYEFSAQAGSSSERNYQPPRRRRRKGKLQLQYYNNS